MERQLGRLGQIDPSHKERYYFATNQIIFGSRILDAGCGCGYGSCILSKRGDVTGVDLSEEAIKFALKTYPGTFVLGDVLEVKDEYDVIVAFEIIEHVKEYKKLLSNFSKLSYLLICSVPNETLYPFDKDNFKDDEYPHLRHFTPKEFRDVLNETGWEVLNEHSQESKFNPVVHDGVHGKYMVFICESKFLPNS